MRKKYLKIGMAVLCGIICFLTDFYLIPLFFMKGIEDMIWMSLMLVLPLFHAVVMMGTVGKCEAKHVFFSLLIQLVMAIVLFVPTGTMLGFRLVSFEEDFFDWIAYAGYLFGWIAAVSILQYIVLKLMDKLKRG